MPEIDTESECMSPGCDYPTDATGMLCERHHTWWTVAIRRLEPDAAPWNVYSPAPPRDPTSSLYLISGGRWRNSAIWERAAMLLAVGRRPVMSRNFMDHEQTCEYALMETACTCEVERPTPLSVADSMRLRALAGFGGRDPFTLHTAVMDDPQPGPAVTPQPWPDVIVDAVPVADWNPVTAENWNAAVETWDVEDEVAATYGEPATLDSEPSDHLLDLRRLPASLDRRLHDLRETIVNSDEATLEDARTVDEVIELLKWEPAPAPAPDRVPNHTRDDALNASGFHVSDNTLETFRLHLDRALAERVPEDDPAPAGCGGICDCECEQHTGLHTCEEDVGYPSVAIERYDECICGPNGGPVFEDDIEAAAFFCWAHPDYQTIMYQAVNGMIRGRAARTYLEWNDRLAILPASEASIYAVLSGREDDVRAELAAARRERTDF